jgi:pyruvate dehydrogenase E2 component (dihydrolipoamide acetyltransferase)
VTGIFHSGHFHFSTVIFNDCFAFFRYSLFLLYFMDVKLPKLGEGAESGTVITVSVKEGDQIKKGQTIVELESEKATMPIPSTASGTVKRVAVKPGDRINVGSLLLVVEGADGGSAAASEAPAEKKQSKPAKKTRPEPEAADDSGDEEYDDVDADEDGQGEDAASRAGLPIAAAPSVRKLARDIGLDLRKISGSEEGGRIVLADIKAYIQRLQRLARRGRSGGGAAEPEPKPAAPQIDFSQWGSILKKPLTPLRQTIARRMLENKNTIPHVTQFDEADITGLTELRKKHASAYEAKGARLTLTSFALKAVADTLKKFPVFNSSLDEAAQELILKEYYHIGLAVDTESGLLVPVIRDVDKKDLLQLSKDVQEAAEKARDRKITAEDMRGGTFTISNQGGIGGAHFTPIINKPEVAILGLGRASLKPVVTREKKIEPRLMMPLALSYDHRVIDGGTAARFIVELAQAFESFKDESIKL